MGMRGIRPFELIVCLAVVVAPCFAAGSRVVFDDPFDDASRQYTAGKFEPALATFGWLARSGDARAQYLLGLDLIEGSHIARDVPQGFAWILIAADDRENGDLVSSAARTARAQIEPQLVAADLVRARQIVDEYHASVLASEAQYAQSAVPVLQPDPDAKNVRAVAGCAAQKREGCGTATPGRRHDGHACTGAVVDPDSLPGMTGPRAQILIPPQPTKEWQFPHREPIFLGLDVDGSGYVCRAAIVKSSGFQELDHAALETAARWRLRPAYKGGQPVESYFVVQTRFQALKFGDEHPL